MGPPCPQPPPAHPRSPAADAEAAAFVTEGLAYAQRLSAALDSWRLSALLGGQFDSGDAVLSIQAGAGGTEAQDWAAMLERMYTRWAGRRGCTVTVLDRAPGDEAGVKSVELEARGGGRGGGQGVGPSVRARTVWPALCPRAPLPLPPRAW